MANRYAERIGIATSGDVRIDVFPASVLGREIELLKQVMGGAIDMALLQSSLGSAVSSFKLFDLPFLVQDRRHMRALFDELVQPVMGPQARERGIEVLAIVDGGFRQLNTKTPVRSPQDLKGLKVRTVGSQQVASLFENFGAQPVLLPFGEVFAAASANIINAADLPISAILAMRSYEVLPYVTLTNHVYIPVYLVIGTSALRRLSDRSRQALFENAKELMLVSFSEGEAGELRDLERLRGRASIIKLDAADMRFFTEISRKSYDSFAFELKGSSDLISRALRLAPRS
jgi:TRAP-type C4-dicarboxylate transport system substrate-binding protein